MFHKASMAVIALLAMAAPLAAQNAGPDTVVATVNGEQVTLAQMLAMRQSLGQQAGDLPDQALWDTLLDQLIRQTAVAQQGAASMTARDKAGLEVQRRAYLTASAMEKVASPAPTEAELKALYEKSFPANAPKQEYHAAHILVKTEAEAQAAAKRIAGGEDFGTVAAELSTDSSGPNKGDLGWFTPEMMVKPFADAVVALKPGGVSAPVQSDFGWHVVKLIEQRTAAAPAFDAIKDQLAMQIRRERVDAALGKALAAAKIEKTPGLSPALIHDDAILGE